MSRNRLTGDALTTGVLPAGAGTTYNEGLTDDVLLVPTGWAAGAHTVTLNSSIAGQSPPSDGDQIDIYDPLGLLSPAAPLTVTGKIASLGAQIANGNAVANSITMDHPGQSITFTYSNLTGTWTASTNVVTADSAVVLADAATSTIQVSQGRLRTLTATQANVITLGTTGALRGDQIRIVRLDATAFTVSVVNGGTAAGTLSVMVASKINGGLFQFNGTDWIALQPGQQ